MLFTRDADWHKLVTDLFYDFVSTRNDERTNSDFFQNIFTQELFNCWKIHNKYVLKYLVQIQIIQNQFKISEGGKWNSHQMPCVYSGTLIDTSWLLIYFMILWAFYLFE
jgi:hypothetical protein